MSEKGTSTPPAGDKKSPPGSGSGSGSKKTSQDPSTPAKTGEGDTGAASLPGTPKIDPPAKRLRDNNVVDNYKDLDDEQAARARRVDAGEDLGAGGAGDGGAGAKGSKPSTPKGEDASKKTSLGSGGKKSEGSA